DFVNRQPEILLQSEIKLEESVAPANIAACGAERLVDSRYRDVGLVEVVVDSPLIGRREHWSTDVGAQRYSAQKTGQIRGNRGRLISQVDRLPAQHLIDAGHRPAADHTVKHRRHVMAQSPPSPKRQFPHETGSVVERLI